MISMRHRLKIKKLRVLVIFISLKSDKFSPEEDTRIKESKEGANSLSVKLLVDHNNVRTKFDELLCLHSTVSTSC